MSDATTALGELFMIERLNNRAFFKMLLSHLANSRADFNISSLLDEMYLMQEHYPTMDVHGDTDEGGRQRIGLQFWGELIKMVEEARSSAEASSDTLS